MSTQTLFSDQVKTTSCSGQFDYTKQMKNISLIFSCIFFSPTQSALTEWPSHSCTVTGPTILQPVQRKSQGI